MFYVYVIQSTANGTLYTGQTSNLRNRLKSHNLGGSRYTKNRGPWKLLHAEEYSTRSEAMKREKYLKTGKGREFINSLSQ